jgi:hypothetical protein
MAGGDIKRPQNFLSNFLQDVPGNTRLSVLIKAILPAVLCTVSSDIKAP